jgi:Zn-finger protein
LYSLNDCVNRSRSVSPGNIRNYSSTRARTRSPSPSRRSIKTSQSPSRRSNLHLYNDYHNKDNGKVIYFPFFFLNYPSSYLSELSHLEFHSIKDCAICRLHHIHSEQSRKAKFLEQVVKKEKKCTRKTSMRKVFFS